MRRIAVRGIIEKDAKIFAQKLKHADGDHNSFWCTPGGGMDDNESVFDCLTREMIEETGVKPVIGRLLYVQQYTEGDMEHLEFFFEIKNVSDYESIDLSHTSHGEIEVAEYGFVDPGQETVLPEFLATTLKSDVVNTQFFDYLAS